MESVSRMATSTSLQLVGNWACGGNARFRLESGKLLDFLTQLSCQASYS